MKCFREISIHDTSMNSLSSALDAPMWYYADVIHLYNLYFLVINQNVANHQQDFVSMALQY